MLVTFQNPQYLFLLILIPLLWGIHFFSINVSKKNALKFANFDAISRIEGVDFFSKNLIVLFLSSLIVLFLVFSASGFMLNITPVRGASFFSFVVAIDSSQSMSADDIFPNRLSASKETAINFVNEMPLGTKAGVISFSSLAYIEQEVTENKNDLINSIYGIGLSEYGGTDFLEVILTSAKLLRDERNKALILISDGQSNMGDTIDIIDYANKNDISIYSIAVGTKEGGETLYSSSKLDEETLKNLAEKTGGDYYLAENQESLAQSFTEILRLTKEEISLNMSFYFLIFGIILFVIVFFLINTKYFNYIR
ncbi:VWA domain-containing protein [Candidatus Pacearchaeota archaeon]|nr:VWA domain-containing protein [Candidatus Pacearchaeota archaeon]